MRRLRRVRGGFKLAHPLVIRKVFERPASQNNHSELAREKSVLWSCGGPISRKEHPMWPWWIDVMLSAGGVATVGLAVTWLIINHYTRGMNLD